MANCSLTPWEDTASRLRTVSNTDGRLYNRSLNSSELIRAILPVFCPSTRVPLLNSTELAAAAVRMISGEDTPTRVAPANVR